MERARGSPEAGAQRGRGSQLRAGAWPCCQVARSPFTQKLCSPSHWHRSGPCRGSRRGCRPRPWPLRAVLRVAMPAASTAASTNPAWQARKRSTPASKPDLSRALISMFPAAVDPVVMARPLSSERQHNQAAQHRLHECESTARSRPDTLHQWIRRSFLDVTARREQARLQRTTHPNLFRSRHSIKTFGQGIALHCHSIVQRLNRPAPVPAWLNVPRRDRPPALQYMYTSRR